MHNCTEEDILDSAEIYFPNCEVIFHEYDEDAEEEYRDMYNDDDDDDIFF